MPRYLPWALPLYLAASVATMFTVVCCGWPRELPWYPADLAAEVTVGLAVVVVPRHAVEYVVGCRGIPRQCPRDAAKKTNNTHPSNPVTYFLTGARPPLCTCTSNLPFSEPSCIDVLCVQLLNTMRICSRHLLALHRHTRNASWARMPRIGSSTTAPKFLRRPMRRRSAISS